MRRHHRIDERTGALEIPVVGDPDFRPRFVDGDLARATEEEIVSNDAADSVVFEHLAHVPEDEAVVRNIYFSHCPKGVGPMGVRAHPPHFGFHTISQRWPSGSAIQAQ